MGKLHDPWDSDFIQEMILALIKQELSPFFPLAPQAFFHPVYSTSSWLSITSVAPLIFLKGKYFWYNGNSKKTKLS